MSAEGSDSVARVGEIGMLSVIESRTALGVMPTTKITRMFTGGGEIVARVGEIETGQDVRRARSDS